MHIEKLTEIVKQLYRRFNEDDVPALGAQLTYYLVLAFFPFLIFVLTMLGYAPQTGELLLENLRRLLPATTYALIRDMIWQTMNNRSKTLLSLSMGIAIWVASDGVLALVRGINKAYGSKETRPFWKTRIMALLFTIALALIILLSLALLVFGEILWRNLLSSSGSAGTMAVGKIVWDIIRYAVSFAVFIMILVLLYMRMPNRALRMKTVLPGSGFAAAAWIVLSLGFSYYINHYTNYANMYGSIGGIIVLLLWLYWSSIILLLGGEINAVLGVR